MYSLPTSVIVDGKDFTVRGNGDYRTILAVLAACQSPELTSTEQTIAAVSIFYECIKDEDDVFGTFDNLQEAVNAISDFISCGDNDIGYKVNRKLIDWEQDEKLITSAVNAVAHTEVRAVPYMHWWTFIGHYMAIGECALSMIVGIRDKIARGKKLEKHEQEFRRQNPHYFRWKKDAEEAAALFDEIWERKEG